MEIVSNITSNQKQYFITLEELAQKLGLKEKITFVNFVPMDEDTPRGALITTETVLDV